MHSIVRAVDFACCLALALVLSVAGNVALAQDAATIERVSGNVSIASPNEAPRPARVNDVLREGDTIETEAGGEALLKVRDESRFSVRQNTRFVLAQFRYEQRDDDMLVTRLLKGTVRAVTGAIAKRRRSAVVFSAITATIGVRGTDFEVAVLLEDEGDQRAGTYNYVHDGATSMQIASGQSLDVDVDHTGLALANPRPGEDPLQLIRGRPAFLRGGGFDAMMLPSTTLPQRIIPMIPRMK